VKKKIGITGQHGFLGYHLYQTIYRLKEEFELVDFERSYFVNEKALDAFTAQCDVIVHLAAINRHNDLDAIYQTNIGLVKQLIASLERSGSKAHVLMSSSTQEDRDNLYGRSKKEGRLALVDWANRSGGMFTGLVIPNVYGPFGQPFYNSVVATFCHQIARNETPKIEVDGQLKLIYVGEVVEAILQAIHTAKMAAEKVLMHSAEAKVSEILSLLQRFKKVYQDNGEIPALNNAFEHKLFNTYRCYMDIPAYFPRKFVQHTDNRGSFVEIARHGIPGQTSFSTTVPGITRGNHFHTRKIERFTVIKGKAIIQLRRVGTAEVHNFYLDGEEPAYVDMPIWYTHNIKNIGDETLYTNFWIDEPFDRADPDTYFETV
jgi:UDP-2-acetamido-2,6-beta-L-arabino-hexul-4-ose reductase